jgi:hypothetical protein
MGVPVAPSPLSGRACILLSTYNGSRFILEQLDSLTGQLDCLVDILVRDDGSTDDTVEKLRSRSRADGRLTIVAGSNLGVTNSFLSLLREAPDGYAAYFFCDQDDVWNPRKVSCAMQTLSAQAAATPALYFCRLRYVSETGALLGSSRVPPHVGLQNALVENVAIGCTVAMNGAARRAICERLPKRAIMHDWWCYLVVSALGVVVFDPRTLIDYRQHGGNTVGADQGKLAVRVVRRFRRKADVVTRSAQAAEFLLLYSDVMPRESRQLVELFVAGKQSLRRRIDLLRQQLVRRSTWSDQLLMSFQLAVNDY